MRILLGDNDYQAKARFYSPHGHAWEGKLARVGPRPLATPPPSRASGPVLRKQGRARDGVGGPGGQGTRRRLPGLGSRSSSSADPLALKPGGSAGPIRSLAIRGGRHWSRTQVYPHRVKPPH